MLSFILYLCLEFRDAAPGVEVQQYKKRGAKSSAFNWPFSASRCLEVRHYLDQPPSDGDQESLTMQFGRVDQTSSFDAASPLSALQAGRGLGLVDGQGELGLKLEAFAIALSVFDDRVYEALRIYYWEAESARSESQVP